MEHSKQCPFCGEEILYVAKKCKHCGEKLYLSWICDNCNSINDERNQCCFKCGLYKNAFNETEDEMTSVYKLDIPDYLPKIVRSELERMSADKQDEFIEEYDRKSKSVGFAYLLFIFPGIHFGYLRKWTLQIVYWLTIGGFLIWWFICLFRLKGFVRNYNRDVAIDIIKTMKSIY